MMVVLGLKGFGWLPRATRTAGVSSTGEAGSECFAAAKSTWQDIQQAPAYFLYPFKGVFWNILLCKTQTQTIQIPPLSPTNML